MGAEYARLRFGVTEPRIGLLSIGEEMGKGDELRKRTYDLFAKVSGFIGNVEGCDLTLGKADVVVCDGFTGNVTLKALEGGFRTVLGLVADGLGLDRGGRAGPRGAAARSWGTSSPSTIRTPGEERCSSG